MGGLATNLGGLRNPADQYVAPVKARPHDADVRPYDHVSLILDLDRDYSTYFRLQVDQRGCVCDDCWGDRTWDPGWYVALHSERTSGSPRPIPGLDELPRTKRWKTLSPSSAGTPGP